MFLDELNELVGTLKQRIEQYREVLGKNEAATRYALIDPLLTALGWDLSNPAQVQTEYSTSDGRADYALLAGENVPRLVIEAKRLNQPITIKVIKQAFDYCSELGIPRFVVTNGEHWVACETHKPVPLADKQVVEFRIGDATQSTVVQMLWLWRGNFEADRPLEAVVPEQPEPEVTTPPNPNLAPDPTQPQPVAQGIPLSEFNPKTGDPLPVALIFFDGMNKSITRWNQIQMATVEWLTDTGRLSVSDCPVATPQGKHLVHTAPVRSGGGRFRTPKQIGSLHIEAHGSSITQVTVTKQILTARGIDLSTVRVALPD